MIQRFEVELLEEAYEFLASLDLKTRKKIFQNLRKAQYSIDHQLFKKLSGEIWEFRTLYNGKQYRLMAFWDKSDDKATMVIATHGFVKKTGKVDSKEIDKAENVRLKYFNQ